MFYDWSYSGQLRQLLVKQETKQNEITPKILILTNGIVANFITCSMELVVSA